MKILVLAEEQQIQLALSRFFQQRGRDYQICSAAELVGQPDIVDFLHRHSIDLLLNTASLSLLGQRTDSERVAKATQLAEACHRAQVILMHLSSSLVFDGLDGGRHREIDEAVPASRVGALHWQIEQAVRAKCERHVILRSMPLFSDQPGNLLTALIAQFQTAQELQVSTTGKAAPVCCDDLARVLSAMIDQLSCEADVFGTYHYGASDPVNYFQFAETVLTVVSQHIDTTAVSLKAIESSDTAWPQPLLNCDKIRTTFGIKQLPWRSYIAGSVKPLFNTGADE